MFPDYQRAQAEQKLASCVEEVSFSSMPTSQAMGYAWKNTGESGVPLKYTANVNTEVTTKIKES